MTPNSHHHHRLFYIPLRILLLIIVDSSIAFVSTEALCPSGCYCPSAFEAKCCLFPANSPSFSSPPTLECQIPGVRDPILADAFRHWPQIDTCATDWTSLSIHVLPGGWPLTRPPPSTCDSDIRHLTFTGDGLTSLKSSDFRFIFGSRLRRLESFVVEQSGLQTLEPGLFELLSTKSLRSIRIVHNAKLGSMGLRIAVFSNLPELTELDLSNNSIDTLDFVRWGFPSNVGRPSRLTKLNLANNRLTFIANGTFALFPDLEELYLAENRLSCLYSKVFINLTRLNQLDLSGNLLSLRDGCMSETTNFSLYLAALEKLDLSRNPLMRNGGETPSGLSWWLSERCPPNLKSLSMNNIDVNVDSPEPLLPKVAWVRCPGLELVEVGQAPRLPCLPSAWLQSDVLPRKPAIISSAAHVCRPPPPPTTSTTMRPTTNQPSGILSGNSSPKLKNHHDEEDIFGVFTKPESMTLRELVVSCVAGGVLLILLVILIVSIIVCRRRRWLYGSMRKRHGSNGKMDHVMKTSETCGMGAKVASSTYIHARDCQLPISDDEEVLSESAGSRILYNANGIPVCSMIMPDSMSAAPAAAAVMMSNGTLAYLPQYVLQPGYAAASCGAGSSLMENGYRGSHVFLKHPLMVPLLPGQSSLATSQMDFSVASSAGRRHSSRHPSRPKHRSHPQPASSLSCKSTSFSSIGGSMHSETQPDRSQLSQTQMGRFPPGLAQHQPAPRQPGVAPAFGVRGPPIATIEPSRNDFRRHQQHQPDSSCCDAHSFTEEATTTPSASAASSCPSSESTPNASPNSLMTTENHQPNPGQPRLQQQQLPCN